MFPIAPIISSIITFLQTVSLGTNAMRGVSDGVVSILQRVLEILSFIPPFDSRVQLACVAYVFALLLMCVLIFPAAPVPATLFPRNGGAPRDSAISLSRDMRDFYMTGIATGGADSVVSIEARLLAFTDPRHNCTVPQKLMLPCIILACALCAGVAAAVLYRVYKYTAIAIALATLCAPLTLCFVLSVVFAFAGCCSKIRVLLLRVCIVLLELIYIPVAEALVDMLHYDTPCGDGFVCVLENSRLDTVRRNYTCCSIGNITSEYACWRTSPYGEPWLNYKTDIVRHFSPFIAYTVLAVVVGVPVLEFIICYRCGKIIECAYTTGDTAEQMYEDALSNIKTPMMYTFFAYKHKYVYMPALMFGYKSAVVGASHVDDTILHMPVLLPALTGIAVIASRVIAVYRYPVCQAMDTVMYALSCVVCLLPLFVKNAAVITIAKCAASCVPVLVFVFVFIALRVHKKRMGDVDVLSVDGYSEDGEVVRSRQAGLYAGIDSIINSEVSRIIALYGTAQALLGAVVYVYFCCCVRTAD